MSPIDLTYMKQFFITKKIETTIAKLIGIVFLMSGFVKGLDMPSTALKIREYFNAVGYSLPYFVSDILSVSLVAIELLLGTAFLLRFYNRIILWLTATVIVLFLFLTCITALTNQLTDCGCFGSILQIPLWATILKNIILTLFVAILIFDANRKGIQTRYCRATIVSALSWIIFFCAINFAGQPLFGNNILIKGQNLFAFDDTGLLDIEFVNNCLKTPMPNNDALIDKYSMQKNLIIGIISDLKEVNNNSIGKFCDKLKRIDGNGKRILLTSTPLNLIDTKSDKILIGICDSKTLEKILPSGIGVILLNDGIISSIWQQHVSKINQMPKDINSLRSLYSVSRLITGILFWIISFFICINIRSIISWNRKTKKE